MQQKRQYITPATSAVYTVTVQPLAMSTGITDNTGGNADKPGQEKDDGSQSPAKQNNFGFWDEEDDDTHQWNAPLNNML